MSFFYVPPSPEQEAEDLRFLVRNPAGRRALRRLLNAANVLTASPTPHGFGIWLAEEIEKAAPGEFARLITESTNDRLANAKPKRRKDDGD
jgi:hypothetical protein